MYIGYKSKKLKKVCKEIKAAKRLLPQNVKPERLFNRLNALAAFDAMSDIPTVPPFRLHSWKGKRAREWSIDLKGLWRIHFIPAGDFDTDDNGKPVLSTVNEIEIVDIGDFHGW